MAQKWGKTLTILFLAAAGVFSRDSELAAQQPRVQHITLTEAKTKAGAATSSDLGRLMIDAAKYHRQAAQADYFPKVDSLFWNLHFNKFMGQRFELLGREAALPLLAKNQTFAAFTVTQPLTPIFKVKQGVAVARADEVIARAKAAQLTAQMESHVERVYFALLIAQRKETVAAVKAQTAGRAVLVEVAKDLLTARSDVAELTHSLNTLLGFEPDTELDLAPPEPAVETISEREATQQALANNPEIVEAEQTVVKARAAMKLSKLEYVPDVAVVGGYYIQTAIPSVAKDATYIGAIASFNIFDFGKREKIVSERRTQYDMALASVDLMKAKVAATAQKAFLDMQRARRIRDLTRQVVLNPVSTVSYEDPSPTARADRANAELEMFQAELDYRQAYSELKRVIEGR